MSKKKPSINNMADLRYQLTELWDDIKSGKIDPPVAKVLNGTASNIIKSVMVEIEGGRSVGMIGGIDFLELAPKPNKSNQLGNGE